MADPPSWPIGAMLGKLSAENASKQPSTEPAETPIGPDFEWLYLRGE